MKITKIDIKKVTDQENVFGYATIEFDNFLRVTGCVIRDGKFGPWCALPSKKNKDGSYTGIVQTVSKEANKELQEAVISEFQGTKSSSKAKKAEPQDDDSDF